MIFSNKVISLGVGRVSSAQAVDERTIVFVSDGSSLLQRRIGADNKVSTISPKVFSYADDAVFVGNQLLERHGSTLRFAEVYLEDSEDKKL